MIMGLRWDPVVQAERKGVYYCYICDIIHFRSCFRRLPRESPLTEPPAPLLFHFSSTRPKRIVN